MRAAYTISKWPGEVGQDRAKFEISRKFSICLHIVLNNTFRKFVTFKYFQAKVCDSQTVGFEN